MKPKVKIEHCRELWHHLRDGQWHHRKDIPMNNRMIRSVCQEKPEHFLSSQKGYKLTVAATDIELNESIADLRSRIHHMEMRAQALESVCLQRMRKQTDLFEEGTRLQ